MKKLMLVLAALFIAAPVMAAVNFTATDAGNGQLMISYTTTDGDLPRGIALSVSCSDGATTDGVETAVVAVDAAFNCNIDYAYSNQGSYLVGDGHPLADPAAAGVLAGEAADFSISAGVLDMDENQGAGPASADLITIQLLDGGTGSTVVTITADTLRGPDSGVVGSVLASNLETAPVVTTITFTPNECIKSGTALYTQWEMVGKLDCWCFKKQCRGDINGAALGPYWVQLADLQLFKDAYLKLAAQMPPGGYCADLNHAALGPYRVQLADLQIFKTYYLKLAAQVPNCDTTDYNFWLLPDGSVDSVWP